jgi:hypothetical protein
VPASSRIFTPLSRIMTVRLLESSNTELIFESAIGFCNLVQLCRCFRFSEKSSLQQVDQWLKPLRKASGIRFDAICNKMMLCGYTGSYIVIN